MALTSALLKVINKRSFKNKILNARVKYTLQQRLISNSPIEKKTALYDFHVKNGGKIVKFADFLLPVQYSDLSVSNSHIHTRKNVSLFDVSHMLQTYITGKNSLELLEMMCPLDLKGMLNGTCALTVFLNDKGGILDDLIVTKIDSENLYIVSNAGRMTHDKQHILEHIEIMKKNNKTIDVHFCDQMEKSLIALQGPKAAKYLQELCEVDLSELYFMNSKVLTINGVDECRVTRCGYTGEDGFEISMPSEKTVEICEALIQFDEVKLAGLGARDSLRLEAGLCLYGNDIDEFTTPIEANLAWLIHKRRRIDRSFNGAQTIMEQLKGDVLKRRVGIRITSGPPARQGAQITTSNDSTVIGKITSGCPSPSLGGNIAMAYVQEKFKKPKTNVSIIVRNNLIQAQIVQMPFITTNYYIKK